MAGVLKHVVGEWGAILISIGLAISLLGALLSWALLCAEILFATAKDNTMPAFLKKENANHVPVNALWLTNSDDPDIPGDHPGVGGHVHQPDLPGVVDDPRALPVVGGLCGVVVQGRRPTRRPAARVSKTCWWG
jgi:hypothetical protein